MHGDEQPYSNPYSSYSYLSRSHKPSPSHPIALSVTTSTTSEHDPNETTARPGNAHKHAQFLTGALAAATDANRPFADENTAIDDPGVTPVVTHPPSTAATSIAPLESSVQQHSQNEHQHRHSQLPPQKHPAADSNYIFNSSGYSHGLSRPLTPEEQEKLAYLDRLKFFLATAPSQWDGARSNQQSFAPTQSANAYPSTTTTTTTTTTNTSSNSSHGLTSVGSSTGWGMGMPPAGATGHASGDYSHGMHPSLNRFMLPSQEFVTCVLWNGLYHITGTDIVRALVFRFEAFGRPVRNMKKFEEGVFSDLRNLKPGVDACLEEPKSPFLDLLFKYQCIRTQKKQKVFYWFSVPHDRLFLDALERDLKREKMGLEPTTQVVGEPALSFTYDPKRSLFEQFAKAQGVSDGEGELEGEDGGGLAGNESDAELADGTSRMGNLRIDYNSTAEDSEMSDADELTLPEEEREKRKRLKQEQQRKKHLQKIANANANANGAAFFSNLFLLEGSPTYKQRRKKVGGSAGGGTLSRSMSNSSGGSSGPMRRGSDEIDDRGRSRSIGTFPDRHHSHSTSVSRERSYPYPQLHPHYQPHHHYTYPGARPFSFPSMVDEFGPGSRDARERAEPNAAQLFHKQARGELVPADGVVRKPKVPHVTPDVGVLISEGYIAQQVPAQQPFGGAPPMDAGSYAAAAGDAGFGFGQPSSSADSPPAAGHSGTTPYETLTPDGKFRAFMCPLLSCQRLFKRMEHLKRHVRTHTMERPFTCPICQKRFSRSDNLNQHVRTHERSANTTNGGVNAAGVVGAANNADFAPGIGPDGGIAGTGLEMDTGGMSFNAGINMGMWRDAGNNEESDMSGAESEGFEEDGFTFGSNRGLYTFQNQHQQMSDQMIDMFGMGGPGGAGMFNQMGSAEVFNSGDMDARMQMCAVEVQPGDVREIHGGEEEGLLLRSGTGEQIPQGQYASGLYSTYTHRTGSTPDFTESQWSTGLPQPTRSPAFNNMSVPSPPPMGNISQGVRSNRSSIGSPPPGFIPSSNATGPASNSTTLPMYNNGSNPDDYVVTSLSAPSHIQAFDHASLYTSSGNAEGLGTGGPIRRQKSAAPSLLRNGDPIRRPLTASSTGSGEYPMHRHSVSPGPGNMSNDPGNNYNNGGMMTMGMNTMGTMKMGMGVNVNMGGRSYHPYAPGYASSSRSGSAHSSPAMYPVGLPDGGPSVPRRSESRASMLGGVGLQEQIQRQLLGLDAAPGVDHQQPQPGGDASGAGNGGSMFRTNSPSTFPQTESPAPYTIDLPQMYGHTGGVPGGVYEMQQEEQTFYAHH